MSSLWLFPAGSVHIYAIAACLWINSVRPNAPTTVTATTANANTYHQQQPVQTATEA